MSNFELPWNKIIHSTKLKLYFQAKFFYCIGLILISTMPYNMFYLCDYTETCFPLSLLFYRLFIKELCCLCSYLIKNSPSSVDFNESKCITCFRAVVWSFHFQFVNFVLVIQVKNTTAIFFCQFIMFLFLQKKKFLIICLIIWLCRSLFNNLVF